jgi:uncharacterized protein (TIGR03000 family)
MSWYKITVGAALVLTSLLPAAPAAPGRGGGGGRGGFGGRSFAPAGRATFRSPRFGTFPGARFSPFRSPAALRFRTFRTPLRRFRNSASAFFYAPAYPFSFGSIYGLGGGSPGIGPDGAYYPSDEEWDLPLPPDEVPPGPYPGLPEAPTDNTARIFVLLPPDAQLWFEGQATTKKGPRREFYSPKLNPSRTYVYTIRARWKEDDRWVEQQGELEVRANETFVVRFPVDEPEELPPPREPKPAKKKKTPATSRPSRGSPRP